MGNGVKLCGAAVNGRPVPCLCFQDGCRRGLFEVARVSKNDQDGEPELSVVLEIHLEY
jgi:hypothetical protein